MASPFTTVKQYLGLLLLLITASCATYTPKYADKQQVQSGVAGELLHRFYLIGDAGYSPIGGLNPVLMRFRDRLAAAPENSTAFFLGDNIYPSGLPDEDEDPAGYTLARNQLDAQISTLERFKGRPVFIPGNHDWYSGGIKGLKRQEKYIEDILDQKDVFLPENGCPLETIELNDEIFVIVLDSEWYLTNWDTKPAINDDCELKSRDKFWAELESEIKKNADKTILITTHHPVFSYGVHGGQYTLQEQFYPSKGKGPLPVIGSAINLFRKTTGVSTEDLFNKRYLELRKRLVTLAQYGDRVIIASGHEHTLQHIVEEGVTQIVSGAGAKQGATRLLGGSRFSTGMWGYAELDIYKDGSSRVTYYGVDKNGREEQLYQSEVYQKADYADGRQYPSEFAEQVQASVYRPGEVDKSGLSRFIWGKRYREYYGTQILAPTVSLDTLYGGLEPIRKGGGQQSKSLRLKHSSGKEYVMRALRKQAEQFLQAAAFQEQFVMGQFDGTFTENLLEDFYTGAHPYGPFALDVMSDSLGLYHTNPRIFYVPKQLALGKYNEDFGGELYMIEEHVSEGHEELASFGYARDIESTYDMLNQLREDEKYKIDTDLYLRARLFDMLVGDWDRHQDQWRWAEFKLKDADRVIYRPIPRDRDQVFSNMGDGALMGLLVRLMPPMKKWEGFNEEIRNVRTFNANAFALDRVLLNNTRLEDWLKQSAFIRERIDAAVIDASFMGFPPEVRGKTTTEIKRILLARLSRLDSFAESYYRVLQKYVVIYGTDKDDWFDIKSPAPETVQVQGYRIIDGDKEKKFYDYTFDPSLTREIWIYGLDDKDRYVFDLHPKNKIRIRVVGGRGKDYYDLNGTRKATIYDYKSRESVYEGQASRTRIVRTDDYELNTYQPFKLANYTSQFTPGFGFNPDDGVLLGLGYTYTHYGFRRNPFTYQHTLNGAYFFATSGYDLSYTGEFANLLGNWNLQLEARYTSPNFSRNFFGFGNQTENPDDDLGLDYNRVRLRNLHFKPSLVWRGALGAQFKVGLSYENISVEETSDRFINVFLTANGEESQTEFLGVHGAYFYENRDNAAFPTLGMSSSLEFGAKSQYFGSGATFAYLIPSLSLDHRLVSSGALVLATKWKAHFNIGNGYEFYQAAQIGANNGPRSYRNERFTGKSAYYQLTDLRLQFRQMKTGLFPLSFGLFSGFDYGRVWEPSESSSKWHTSYGGGFFLNGANVSSINFALFHGGDGLRFSFGLGFAF
ncbi:metallophosphoesterase [Robiginitalea sp. IMCC44478]|uniref:metallophosphoesterase n=1 Tax=Robiginitalea sp. IMCC44478 TaxID=3459122 RepID=UPI0040420D59